MADKDFELILRVQADIQTPVAQLRTLNDQMRIIESGAQEASTCLQSLTSAANGVNTKLKSLGWARVSVPRVRSCGVWWASSLASQPSAQSPASSKTSSLSTRRWATWRKKSAYPLRRSRHSGRSRSTMAAICRVCSRHSSSRACRYRLEPDRRARGADDEHQPAAVPAVDPGTAV